MPVPPFCELSDGGLRQGVLMCLMKTWSCSLLPMSSLEGGCRTSLCWLVKMLAALGNCILIVSRKR